MTACVRSPGHWHSAACALGNHDQCNDPACKCKTHDDQETR